MSRRSQTLESQVYYVIQNINLCDDKEKRAEIYNSLSGESKDSVGKREFKSIGKSVDYIFSRNTIKNVLIQNNRFVNYCKENYNVRRLVQITPEMSKSYLQSRKDEGVSSSTLRVIKNSIMKLDAGMRQSYRSSPNIYNQEVRGFAVGESTVSSRTYTSEEVRAIIDEVKEFSSYGKAFEVQLDLGLRVSELVNLRGSDITIGRGEIVEIPKFGSVDTSDTVRIQGKGGLVRYVEIPSDKIQEYRQMKESSGDSKVFNTSRDYIRKVFYKACSRLEIEKSYKTHEIRKEYARGEVAKEIEEFRSREGRSPNRDELYNIKGQVVQKLGHGRNRSDLIRIYCS